MSFPRAQANRCPFNGVTQEVPIIPPVVQMAPSIPALAPHIAPIGDNLYSSFAGPGVFNIPPTVQANKNPDSLHPKSGSSSSKEQLLLYSGGKTGVSSIPTAGSGEKKSADYSTSSNSVAIGISSDPEKQCPSSCTTTCYHPTSELVVTTPPARQYKQRRIYKKNFFRKHFQKNEIISAKKQLFHRMNSSKEKNGENGKQDSRKDTSRTSPSGKNPRMDSDTSKSLPYDSTLNTTVATDFALRRPKEKRIDTFIQRTFGGLPTIFREDDIVESRVGHTLSHGASLTIDKDGRKQAFVQPETSNKTLASASSTATNSKQAPPGHTPHSPNQVRGSNSCSNSYNRRPRSRSPKEDYHRRGDRSLRAIPEARSSSSERDKSRDRSAERDRKTIGSGVSRQLAVGTNRRFSTEGIIDRRRINENLKKLDDEIKERWKNQQNPGNNTRGNNTSSLKPDQKRDDKEEEHDDKEELSDAKGSKEKVTDIKTVPKTSIVARLVKSNGGEIKTELKILPDELVKGKNIVRKSKPVKTFKFEEIDDKAVYDMMYRTENVAGALSLLDISHENYSMAANMKSSHGNFSSTQKTSSSQLYGGSSQYGGNIFSTSSSSGMINTRNNYTNSLHSTSGHNPDDIADTYNSSIDGGGGDPLLSTQDILGRTIDSMGLRNPYISSGGGGKNGVAKIISEVTSSEMDFGIIQLHDSSGLSPATAGLIIDDITPISSTLRQSPTGSDRPLSANRLDLSATSPLNGSPSQSNASPVQSNASPKHDSPLIAQQIKEGSPTQSNVSPINITHSKSSDRSRSLEEQENNNSSPQSPLSLMDKVEQQRLERERVEKEKKEKERLEQQFNLNAIWSGRKSKSPMVANNRALIEKELGGGKKKKNEKEKSSTTSAEKDINGMATVHESESQGQLLQDKNEGQEEPLRQDPYRNEQDRRRRKKLKRPNPYITTLNLDKPNTLSETDRELVDFSPHNRQDLKDGNSNGKMNGRMGVNNDSDFLSDSSFNPENLIGTFGGFTTKQMDNNYIDKLVFAFDKSLLNRTDNQQFHIVQGKLGATLK